MKRRQHHMRDIRYKNKMSEKKSTKLLSWLLTLSWTCWVFICVCVCVYTCSCVFVFRVYLCVCVFVCVLYGAYMHI